MAFYIIATLIVATALLVIFSKNTIISALWLVVCLFMQAALFVLLDAHLVAALQVLLYAGAIMVLIIFVIMVLNLAPKSLKFKTITGERIIIGSGVLYVAGALGIAIATLGTVGTAETAETVGTVAGVGEILLTKYLVPFELISVLLLVAIVGTVVLSQKDK